METSSNDGETWTELWSRSGNQGEGWLNSRVTLQTTDTTTLRFVGTTAGDTSDFAIDDFVAWQGPDPFSPSQAPTQTAGSTSSRAPTTPPAPEMPGPTIPPTWTPTSTPTYPREVCDFDTSECGFSDNGGRDWVRHSGPTPSYPQTGPGSDHTSGYGSYMFVESSSPNSPNVGPFVLQTDLSEGVSYVDFWYHMYGFASKFVYPFYEHKPGK